MAFLRSMPTDNIFWKPDHCLDEGAPIAPEGNFRATQEAITAFREKRREG